MIPLPYLLAGSLAIGAFGGWKLTANHYDAQALAAERAAAAHYQAEVRRGNELAVQLATAESQIREIAKWKGKQIAKVTVNRTCLSGDAVGLLNATAAPVPTEPGPASAEVATGTAATDAEVLDWAIDARERYAACAARLNSAIEFEVGRK